MKQLKFRLTLWLVVLFALAPNLLAQRLQREPHIGFVYPAGGRQGSVLEVAIGGQSLGGSTDAIVSGKGVLVAVTGYSKPMTPRELSSLRPKLQEVRKRMEVESQNTGMSRRGDISTRFMDLAREMGITNEELEKFANLRKGRTDPKRQLNSQIAETVTLQVELAPDAQPGKRELRLVTRSGLSNPVSFFVAGLPEHSEIEPNDEAPDTGILKTPVILNGQIMPGDIDRFEFDARKDSRLVVSASARELIPYLADAVPGWFQAVVAVYDAQGSEVAYADDYRFHPDPVLLCRIPRDGKYTLEIRDALYRGRKDFVYRITMGEVPFITDVFPLGGNELIQTSVEVRGWNLSSDKLIMDVEGSQFGLSVEGGGHSCRVPFAIDTLPEVGEQEPNDQVESAQPISLPVILNGHIEDPGDSEVFQFDAYAGSVVVAEVYARRLNSPLDSLLTLTDDSGRLVMTNDDYEDKASGLITHHADSRLYSTIPEDGRYYLHLSDTQHKGGPEYGYRLRISPPRPDFELRVVPSSVNARAGLTVPITVYALRKDGFSGEIGLALRNAPSGYVLGGGWVPADQEKVRLTLTVPPSGASRPIRLRLDGTASIDGSEIRRTAIPADEMIQAFASRHLVSANDWMIAVSGRRRSRSRLTKLLEEEPVKLSPGGSAQVRFSLPRGINANQIQLALNDPPDGITIKDVNLVREGLAVLLQVDPEEVQPGLKGNLIVDLFLERTVPPREGKPRSEKRQLPLGTLPAVPFEIEGL